MKLGQIDGLPGVLLQRQLGHIGNGFYSQVDYWFQQACVVGLSQAMLVLTSVCLVSAVIVYLGLRRPKS